MITFHFQDDEQINEIARFSRRLKWMKFDTLLLFYLPTEGVSLMPKVEIGFPRKKGSQKIFRSSQNKR